MKGKIISFLVTGAIIINAAIILVPNKFKAYPIVLLLILSLYTFKNASLKRLDFKKMFLLTLPFFIYLIGLAHSPYKSEGLSKIATMSSLVAFPVIFYLLRYSVYKRPSNLERLLLVSFTISTTAFGVGTIVYFWHGGFTLSETIIHYSNLVNIGLGLFSIHPIYLSLYIGLAIIMSLQLITKSITLKYKVLYLITIIINIVILAVLMRKGPIIFLFIICTVWLFMNRSFRFFMLLGVIVIGIVGSITLLPKYKDFNRFKELISLNNNYQEKSSTQIRIDIFSCSLKKIADSPIFGYGTGAVQHELNDCYHTYTNIDTKENYNSHNQYLSILLYFGVIGIFMFTYYIIGIIRLFKKNRFWLMIIIFFFMNFLTENMLERESGVIIYSLLISFFCYQHHYYRETDISL